jgi:hypothetical protein
MQWAVTFLIPFGTIARICKSIWILNYYFQRAQPCHSDVSRISSISVSAYLRTAAAVQGQDDMGNDLLMARVELTPVLEGVVCSLFLISLGQFLRVFQFTSACHRPVVHSYQRLGLFSSQNRF